MTAITDDSKPATKGDLRKLKADLVGSFEPTLNKLSEDVDRVLAVLVNVNNRLTEKVDDHEKRITRLEKVLA